MPTRTIIHPQLEVNSVKYFHAIPKSVSTRTQEKKATLRHPICLTDYDHDCILKEIVRQDKIEFERNLEVYSNDKEN